MRTLARSLALALAAGALVSCGALTGAERAAGVYVLQRVAGDPLPAAIGGNEYFDVETLADTLELHPDGTGRAMRRVRLHRLIAPISTEETSFTSAFHYRTFAGRVEISFDCPPNANCVGGPHLVGMLTGSRLRLDYSLGERVPQEFDAVQR